MKRILDVLIILCGAAFLYFALQEAETWKYAPMIVFVVAAGMMWVLCDLFFQGGRESLEKTEAVYDESEAFQTRGVQRLILLDEDGKPLKSWDLQGRTALIIGKSGQNQEPDIDLFDCAYSSFIDFQHAALNFCLDHWYVEDLDSQNGVKVKKVEDGECYRVIYRPCKLMAGDVLYIANTKLLLT